MKYHLITLFCLIATTIAIIITEMCFFKNKHHGKEHQTQGNYSSLNNTESYESINNDSFNGLNITGNDTSTTPQRMVSAVYYSNWSPYEPKYHFPHDIDLSSITHIYYAFFLADGETGKLKSSDEWSDYKMDFPTQHDNQTNNAYGKKHFLKGCLGELYELKQFNDFKVIMSVGGWSNRDDFPEIASDPHKLKNFMDSCIDTMFKYGFDGIDLDWEFPREDTNENVIMVEMVEGIRERLNKLEVDIWGDLKGRFELSVATPAFRQKLQVLLVKEMDKYLTYWNMMTYDYFGDWSEKTGFHSQLYCDDNNSVNKGKQLKAQYKHSPSNDEGKLCADNAIRYMLNEGQIPSRKLIFGMAMYGRGFKNIECKKDMDGRPTDSRYISNPYEEGYGFDEEEPGIWLYNQLPLSNTIERYDPQRISAFCVDSENSVMVGYDNKNTVKTKAEYIKKNHLGGAFWWESCGNKWTDPQLSLPNVFHKEVARLVDAKSVFRDPPVWEHYLRKWGRDGFLSKFIQTQQKTHRNSTNQLAHP